MGEETDGMYRVGDDVTSASIHIEVFRNQQAKN